MEDVFRKIPSELTKDQERSVNNVKMFAENLYNEFSTTYLDPNNDREIALAKTKLEEAVMWAVKGITK